MTLNLKKKVTLTASQMLAENNRATADRLTRAAQTDEANLRTALNVPENGLTEKMAEEARDRYGRNVLPTSQRTPLYKRLAAAFINPFTIQVAQGIAQLPLLSGMSFRICWRFSAH